LSRQSTRPLFPSLPCFSFSSLLSFPPLESLFIPLKRLEPCFSAPPTRPHHDSLPVPPHARADAHRPSASHDMSCVRIISTHSSPRWQDGRSFIVPCRAVPSRCHGRLSIVGFASAHAPIARQLRDLVICPDERGVVNYVQEQSIMERNITDPSSVSLFRTPYS